MKSRKANVFVLYTGGTLGMVPKDPNNPTSPLKPGTQADLERYLPPGLQEKLGIDYTMESLTDMDGGPVEPIDSSNVTSEHWRWIANAISHKYASFDGFVVLHGTDTMAYTSSVLSFMLANLAKPVVVTGSQLPIAHSRTDAVSNFVNALFVAGSKATDLPLIPEVIVVFAGAVLRGNRVRKMSSSAWQGFDTPNYPHLGTIGEHMRIATEYLRPPADNETSPFYARLDLEDQVADISLFPGIRAEQLGAILLNPSLKGAVLRTFGSGNAPSREDLLQVISDSVKAGKVIVNITQCPEGMVEAGLYEASSGLLERGVISGLDQTPEAALTKLMSLLANEQTAEVQAQMQLDLRGEQSANLYDVRFGGTWAKKKLSAAVNPETDDGLETVDADSKVEPYSSRQDLETVVRSDIGVTVAARLLGQFRRSALQQATVRIRSLTVNGEVPEHTNVRIEMFLNHPSAKVAGVNDPRHAATFEGRVGVDSDFLVDVTAVARQILEDGRPVQITLVNSFNTRTPPGSSPVVAEDGTESVNPKVRLETDHLVQTIKTWQRTDQSMSSEIVAKILERNKSDLLAFFNKISKLGGTIKLEIDWETFFARVSRQIERIQANGDQIEESARSTLSELISQLITWPVAAPTDTRLDFENAYLALFTR
jgi:L-asparaginase